MIYLIDHDVKIPEDATQVFDLREWEYWTPTFGDAVQHWHMDTGFIDFKLITNRPGQYKYLVASRRLINPAHFFSS